MTMTKYKYISINMLIYKIGIGALHKYSVLSLHLLEIAALLDHTDNVDITRKRNFLLKNTAIDVKTRCKEQI